MKNKYILSVFSIALILLATLGIKRGSEAKKEARAALNRTAPKVLDSIINYRFTSYDSKLMFENTVVVDDTGKIIGTLILYTNQKYVDSFYNSNSDWKKTRLFDNIKEGRVRLLSK